MVSSPTRFKELGEILLRQRNASNMQLKDIAATMKCSVQFVSNIEHGRAGIPWHLIRKFAGVYDIAIAELWELNIAANAQFRAAINSIDSRVSNAKIREHARCLVNLAQA